MKVPGVHKEQKITQFIACYFDACTFDASLCTLFPSAHSDGYELQSNNALKNTSNAPSFEISLGGAG